MTTTHVARGASALCGVAATALNATEYPDRATCPACLNAYGQLLRLHYAQEIADLGRALTNTRPAARRSIVELALRDVGDRPSPSSLSELDLPKGWIK
jgi:hypothetical protein